MMHKIIIYIVLFLPFTVLLAQNSGYKTKTEDGYFRLFKEIEKIDKSNLKDTSLRHLNFIANFDTIINFVRSNGFPVATVSKKKDKINRQITLATEITFIHIIQTKPELLLNEEVISILQIELNKGSLNKKSLSTVLRIGKVDQENNRGTKWSEITSRMFEIALASWEIQLDE